MKDQFLVHLANLAARVTKLETRETAAVSGWVDYSAGLFGTGGVAGTYAEDSVIQRYCVVGKICFLRIRKRVTNKGSWTGNVSLLLPIAAVMQSGAIVYEGPPCWWANAAAPTTPKAFARWQNSTTLNFTDQLNTSFLDWTELSVNDTLLLNVAYEI